MSCKGDRFAKRDVGYNITYIHSNIAFVIKSVLLVNVTRPEGETAVMILAVGKRDPAYELPSIERKPIDQISKFY